MSKFKYNGLSQRFGGTPGLKCDQFLCITCPVYIGAFHQLEYPSSAAWQHPRDVIEYTSVASGVFRNLKRGCPGLHFRCTFSKVFLTKYLCKKLYFNSRGQPQFTSSNLLLGDNLLQKPPSPPPPIYANTPLYVAIILHCFNTLTYRRVWCWCVRYRAVGCLRVVAVDPPRQKLYPGISYKVKRSTVLNFSLPDKHFSVLTIILEFLLMCFNCEWTFSVAWQSWYDYYVVYISSPCPAANFADAYPVFCEYRRRRRLWSISSITIFRHDASFVFHWKKNVKEKKNTCRRETFSN